MAFRDRYATHKWLKDGLHGPILQCQDQTSAQAMVAVKVVSLGHHHPFHGQLKACEQATQECRIIEILRAAGVHPNVLQFHGIYLEEHDAAQLIVMEFCRGGDLQELLERQPFGRFPEPQALQFFAQIVAGVQFLHANDIAHRDLSLENVLVTDQNVCKIGDFGLSVHSTLTSHEMVGKRFYMAPEVAFGEEYDPQLADLWSLGVILFIMITGTPLVDYHTAAKAQKEINEMILTIIKLHGASKLLELWGLEWMVSSKTRRLLDGMLQVVPSDRLRPEAILQVLDDIDQQ